MDIGDSDGAPSSVRMWDLGEATPSPLSRFEREEHEAAVAREGE